MPSTILPHPEERPQARLEGREMGVQMAFGRGRATPRNISPAGASPRSPRSTARDRAEQRQELLLVAEIGTGGIAEGIAAAAIALVEHGVEVPRLLAGKTLMNRVSPKLQY